MIYPDVTVEDWIAKHPALEVSKCSCIDCGVEIKSDKPYMSRDYIGLESKPCVCGSTRSKCSSSVPYSSVEQKAWGQLIGFYVLEEEV
jgi:hypothetical protein